MERKLSNYKLNFTTSHAGRKIVLYSLNLDNRSTFNSDQIGSVRLDSYHDLKNDKKIFIASDKDGFVIMEPKDEGKKTYYPIVFFSEEEKWTLSNFDDTRIRMITRFNEFYDANENICKTFDLKPDDSLSVIMTKNGSPQSYLRHETIQLENSSEEIKITYDTDLKNKSTESVANRESRYEAPVPTDKKREAIAGATILLSLLAAICLSVKACQVKKEVPEEQKEVPTRNVTPVLNRQAAAYPFKSEHVRA